MGFLAPKERKHLSADALFGFVRSLFANVPDHCSNDTSMTLTDALMAGFAMFSLKCPSLLDFDKQRAEGNLKTIYRITRTPCDSYMREMLDPVAPAYASCAGDHAPALRNTGIAARRGEGLPGYWTVLFVRAMVAHPAGYKSPPRPENTFTQGLLLPSMQSSSLGIREA